MKKNFLIAIVVLVLIVCILLLILKGKRNEAKHLREKVSDLQNENSKVREVVLQKTIASEGAISSIEEEYREFKNKTKAVREWEKERKKELEAKFSGEEKDEALEDFKDAFGLD